MLPQSIEHLLSRLRSFLAAWSRRERFEHSLDEEVRFHIAACTADLVRSGVPRAEAVRRARVHFGSIEGMKDGCRQARGLRLADELEHMMTNIRLALRTMLKTPVVTGVAIVSLALGIGSNVAIFSIYSQLVLQPLPVADPERLVNLTSPGPKPGSCSSDNAGNCDDTFSYPMLRDLQRGQEVFTEIAAHKGLRANVAHAGRAANVQGAQVSGSYFSVLGLPPAAGRLFGPEIDESIGGHPVVVLSHDFWQSEFGGSPDAIGDVLVVNGRSLTIVGVAPAGFRGTTINMPCEFFVPITMRGLLSPERDGQFEDRRAYWTYLFARLAPGVSIEQARAALEPRYRSILADLEAPLQAGMSGQTLARFLDRPLQIEPGRQGQSLMNRTGGRVALFFLFGVTAAVLLIACANIANLLLARSAARAGEMAVRLSLGASRRHLLTQLLTESCLLALMAGAAGLVVAYWTLRLVGTLLPPLAADALRAALELDPNAVPFTAAVSLATAFLFGSFPALRAARADPIVVLKDDAGQPGGTRSAARVRHGLVVSQIALAVTLLVAAGLFIQSLRNVNRIDLGFRTENVVTFHLWPALNGYDDVRNRALFERVRNGLQAQPGVAGVTASTRGLLQFGGTGVPTEVMVQGFEAGPDTNRTALLNGIEIDYFRTLGVPLLAGRAFSASDTAETPRVAVVNQAFARKFDLGRNAVGRRIGRGDLDAELDIEIVGLVGDTRRSLRNAAPPPLAYVPYRQEEADALWFFVRTSSPPDAVLRSIRALVQEIDPNLPVNILMPLSQMAELNNPDRVVAVLMASFAALATLLAAVGLYGVLAYAVAQRTRELGLRMALGADAARLRAMVLGQIGRMTLAGGAIGLLAALGVARVLRAALYEIDSPPPAIVAAAVAGLAAVALAAGFVPAYRASRIDPMEALRHK